MIRKIKRLLFSIKITETIGKIKPTTMDAIDFSRRFCMHILPKRFVKVEGETIIERLRRLTGFDICKCPKCKKGKMKTIEEIPRIRLSVNDFLF